MKFTDGNWLLRPGVAAFYPAEAYDVDVAPDVLTVYAPTTRVAHRGDTLKGPLLTVELSSPMADVIRVRLSHFAGGQPRGPRFALHEQPAEDVELLLRLNLLTPVELCRQLVPRLLARL
ncbi:MAG TPA: hypothetical protein PLO33_14925, partial [Kouleothrix sp.]|nr:hypothetical protein [Kouleothrix sp.]